MMDHLQIDFEPVGRRVDCAPGSTLLEAAQQAGVMVTAICGGEGVCGRCVLHVLSGDVSEPSSIEQAEIAAADLRRGVRLACQTFAHTDVKVHIPPESLATAQRVQVESEAVLTELAPAVSAHELRLAAPSLGDLRADATRLRGALDAGQIDTLALRRLPEDLRAWNWQARALLRGAELIAVRPSGRRVLGLAVDIGTTKLAGYLLDLETGQTLGAAGAMNPQIAYGEDVMSRIAYVMAGQGQDRLQTLQTAVSGAIGDLAVSLCARAEAGAEPADIADAVVVGNTAMHHLFAGLPVSQLGVAPYVPVVSDPLDLKARDVGLGFAPGAYVHLLPNVAGFVGADHVAMALASGLGERGPAAQVTLGLDIGTNTEISLRARGKLWACSAASGPAFEGAHIEYGMRAAPGAIERAIVDGDQVYLKTVDDAPPAGICGSGLVDLIAQLRRAGVLDARGAFRAHPRVQDNRFIVVPGESNGGRLISLSRADVAEIQLAKAAIRAGISILLRRAGLAESDLDQVIIAGAFGTYLDVPNSVKIGLLPPLERSRFRQVGNAAGAGARMALLSLRQRDRAASLARRVEYVELTTEPTFQREFAGALRF